MAMSELLQYGNLRLIWWLLLGVLLSGFAIMDGFDLGVGALLPWVARSDEERRITINTIAPFWEGNQAWLILSGGAIFAAWPMLYALSFSGFYWAMMLVLFFLILRPVAIKYRSKHYNARWRQIWDISLLLSGAIPAIIFGVAVGNALEGIPFHLTKSLTIYYTGHFLGLLNPFALLCGVLSLAMLLMHGGIYLCIKTYDPIQSRAHSAARLFGWLTLILFIAGGFWIQHQVSGYSLITPLAPDAPSNPLRKEVTRAIGGWLVNFKNYPYLWGAPTLTMIGILLTQLLLRSKKYIAAWISSSLSILGIIFTVGFAMFPFLLPSSSHPNMSLTVWDSSSSKLTLQIMLFVTLVFMPITLLYISWAYRVMRGKVTADYLKQEQSSY